MTDVSALSAPLLVTLRMDDAAFALFNGLRQRHFPPERNHIPAHITLFHALPGGEIATVTNCLQKTGATTAPFAMQTNGLMFLGQGTAFVVNSPQATILRADLAILFQPWLTPQDARQGFKPHITVQNKVPADIAKALHARLVADFTPQPIKAQGLDLWHYRGGPWEHSAYFPFQA